MLRGTLYKLGLPKFPKSAGTIKEFRDWEKKLESEYPIRYAIGESINLFFRPLRTAKRKLKNAYWWVQYRVNPKHKYTTIKLKRLDPGYHDPDILLFYSMFEIFEGFMKTQLTDSHVKWVLTKDDFEEWWEEKDVEKEMKKRNDLWDEMNTIYDWWINVYPNREGTLPEYPKIPKEWGLMAVFNEDFDDEEIMIEYKKIIKIHLKMEEDWNKEDEEMMHRLIKIHSNLWD